MYPQGSKNQIAKMHVVRGVMVGKVKASAVVVMLIGWPKTAKNLARNVNNGLLKLFDFLKIYSGRGNYGLLKGPIIHFIEGRSPSSHKLRFCI